MKRTAFFDLDNTLADFYHGTMRTHGLAFPIAEATWDYPIQCGFKSNSDPAFWGPMTDNPSWWADLLPWEDGMELFRRVESAIGRDRIGFLSDGQCPGSPEGKRLWLAKNLPGYEGKLVTATAKHLIAAPCKVLIDDGDHNLFGDDTHVGFIPAGGRGCLIARPWNRNRHLCDNLGRFQVAQVLDELVPLLEESI